jgi:hypothetical protein
MRQSFRSTWEGLLDLVSTKCIARPHAADPIHIGCGQDFEPTNYVIDAGSLYHFEPARVALSESERGELVRSANRPGNEAFRAVQYFFHQRKPACRTASRLRVAVAPGVAEEYDRRIGRVAQHERGGRAVINRLVIERTAYHPYSGRPYIPGSSLKGSMRTAWLSSLAPTEAAGCDRERGSSKKANDLEKQILGGSFSTDPFRLLGVADAAGGELSSRIVFAVNRSKREASTQSRSRTDLSVRCEVIDGGQLRSLKGEIRFTRPGEFADGCVPAQEKRIPDFAALTQACNAFYTLRLSTDLNLLHRLCGSDWTQRFQSLMTSLQPLFDDGRAMLMRVGRHSGAESVTLDRWRCIQIRGGKNRSHWASEATTIWLAAESEDSTSDMLPFGWVLIERADTPAPDALKRWCDEELKRPSTDISRPSARARAGLSQGGGSAAPAGSESAQYRFRKGDRVTNGEEQATVQRDVRPADTRMDVRFDDGENRRSAGHCMEKSRLNTSVLQQVPATSAADCAPSLHPGASLPLARYRFSFRMEDDLRLPEYSGSLLRGQFGAALRRNACMTGASTCHPCPLLHTCPYPTIFETPAPSSHPLQHFSQVPNPYVIEPPAFGLRRLSAGETIAFHLVLVGRALAQLPLITHAFERAFAQGFGRDRSRGRLLALEAEGESGIQSVWDAERSRIIPHSQTLTMPRLPRVRTITLKISTPLRLQNQGRPTSPDALRPRTLFTAILRRASLLLELHAGIPALDPAQATRLAASAARVSDDRALRWQDWTRYSSRQKQEMTLGGVVGEWRISGELDELLPWFWLGQWLHVGKNATMGMGMYALIC